MNEETVGVVRRIVEEYLTNFGQEGSADQQARLLFFQTALASL